MRTSVALVTLLAFVLPARGAWAQEPRPGLQDALLNEVRRLREVLELQAPLQARTQLLIGRLTLQDQRVARARASLERAESELASLTLNQNRIRDGLARMQEDLDNAASPQRAALEAEVQGLTSALENSESLAMAAESRRAAAAEAALLEEGRYEELERWFIDLERELSKGPS